MTTLATHDLTEPDLLTLIADTCTPLGKPFADRFREACEAEARENDGWINPSLVRARLLNDPAYAPRTYSAQWAGACGRSGFMVKTDIPVQITGEGSRGNSNKSTVWRRWVGAR